MKLAAGGYVWFGVKIRSRARKSRHDLSWSTCQKNIAYQSCHLHTNRLSRCQTSNGPRPPTLPQALKLAKPRTFALDSSIRFKISQSHSLQGKRHRSRAAGLFSKTIHITPSLISVLSPSLHHLFLDHCPYNPLLTHTQNEFFKMLTHFRLQTSRTTR